jgi:hypothetical protein
MLRIPNIEEVENLLLQLPDLVQSQERRDASFPFKAEGWLGELENVLAANRLYQAGTIATLRSALVAAARGQVPTGLTFRGRASRSQVLHAVASESLRHASEVASALIGENRPRLAEAERVAHQIIAAALSHGVVSNRAGGVSNEQYIRSLRHELVTHGGLESAIVHLEGLAGPHDTLILLDRALAPYLELTMPSPPEAHTPVSG